jgi:hypothetical protein
MSSESYSRGDAFHAQMIDFASSNWASKRPAIRWLYQHGDHWPEEIAEMCDTPLADVQDALNNIP